MKTGYTIKIVTNGNRRKRNFAGLILGMVDGSERMKMYLTHEPTPANIET